MLGILGRLGTSDLIGLVTVLAPCSSVLTKPGGSLAVPRATLSEGEESGPRAVVIRYGAEASSDRMKLTVVSVVDLPRSVRVTTLAVALFPDTVSDLSVSTPPAMSTRPEIGLSRLTKRFSTSEAAFSILLTPTPPFWPT